MRLPLLSHYLFSAPVSPHTGSSSFSTALGVVEGEGLALGTALGVAEGEGLALGTPLFL